MQLSHLVGVAKLSLLVPERGIARQDDKGALANLRAAGQIQLQTRARAVDGGAGTPLAQAVALGGVSLLLLAGVGVVVGAVLGRVAVAGGAARSNDLVVVVVVAVLHVAVHDVAGVGELDRERALAAVVAGAVAALVKGADDTALLAVLGCGHAAVQSCGLAAVGRR